MRDLLLKWRLWFFGPSYYWVRIQDGWAGSLSYTALSRCGQFGGDPETGVFTSYADALAYWKDRQHEPGQPGLVFLIERLSYENVEHRSTVLDYYHHNPEVPKSWA